MISKATVECIPTVSGRKQEGRRTHCESVGDRVRLTAMKIDVKNGAVDAAGVVLEQSKSFVDGAHRADNIDFGSLQIIA
jgi:hypothetical protein